MLESLRRAQEPAKGSRHEAERARLLETLARDDATLSSTHPRHRLLDAIYGYQRYHERQWAEMDRFRGLYKHVTKKQKTVRTKHPFPPLPPSIHTVRSNARVFI